MKKSWVVGVDIGATTIKAGAVDRRGKILDQVVVDTQALRGPRAVLRQLNLAIEEILARHSIRQCGGIGLGSPGVVSVDHEYVLYPPNFADWREVALAQAVRKAFPLPVALENDANCAAIAEAHFGAGSKEPDFIFVIWGTGVGGGIIIDRHIYRGPFGGAGEIGHVTVDRNGPECNCGSRGCIESYIGQRYLSARTRKIVKAAGKRGTASLITTLVNGQLHRIEPAIVSKAALKGDRLAKEILTEAGELLGCALASVMNVLDIRIVVIGGGISAAPRFVFDAVQSSIRRHVLAPHRPGVRVKRASLANGAGIIGAASLILFRE